MWLDQSRKTWTISLNVLNQSQRLMLASGPTNNKSAGRLCSGQETLAAVCKGTTAVWQQRSFQSWGGPCKQKCSWIHLEVSCDHLFLGALVLFCITVGLLCSGTCCVLLFWKLSSCSGRESTLFLTIVLTLQGEFCHWGHCKTDRGHPGN